MTDLESREPGPRARERTISQVVRFYVGEQQYALDIMQVKEIINPVAIAPVPHAPRFVEGIIELRGTFLAVIDLRKRFGLAAPSHPRDAKFMVVMRAGRYLGMIVDRVVDVRRLDAHEIEPAPELVHGPDVRFVTGVVKWDDEIAVLLDLDVLLSVDEIDSWSRDIPGAE